MSPQSPRRLPRALLLAVVALALSAAPVLADAELIATTPEAGSSITDVPDELRLRFDEPLDAGNSSVEVRDAAGTTVVRGAVDPADPTALVAELPALPPGEYEVRWVAGSADGHLVRDTYSFTVVSAPAPSSTPTPAPTATAEPSRTAPPPTPTSTPPSPTPSAAPVVPAPSADSGADVLIPIVAALALVVVLGAVFLRRRRA